MNNFFLLLIVVPLLVACGIAPASSGPIAENYKASVSNGESIYFKATSERFMHV